MNQHLYKKGMIVTVLDNLDSSDKVCGQVEEMKSMIGKSYKIDNITERAVRLGDSKTGKWWFSSKDVTRVLTDEQKAEIEKAKKPAMFDPSDLCE